MKGEALTLITPSEVRSVSEPFKEHADGRMIRCYYCTRGGTETTVLRDGQPVSRWVCAEHAAHPPKRAGGVSTRLRRIVHSGSRGGSRTHLLRRR